MLHAHFGWLLDGWDRQSACPRMSLAMALCRALAATGQHTLGMSSATSDGARTDGVLAGFLGVPRGKEFFIGARTIARPHVYMHAGTHVSTGTWNVPKLEKRMALLRLHKNLQVARGLTRG